MALRAKNHSPCSNDGTTADIVVMSSVTHIQVGWSHWTRMPNSIQRAHNTERVSIAQIDISSGTSEGDLDLILLPCQEVPQRVPSRSGVDQKVRRQSPTACRGTGAGALSEQIQRGAQYLYPALWRISTSPGNESHCH